MIANEVEQCPEGLHKSCLSTDRLDDKLAIVTGANTGIGKALTSELARRGAKVIMACRSSQKANEAIDEMVERYGAGNPDHATIDVVNSSVSKVLTPIAREQLIVEELDLGSMASIRHFAKRIQTNHDRLDLLINNAGVIELTYGQTVDGFEKSVGINHLGPFLLTQLLLPQLKTSAVPSSRIILTASLTHLFAKFHRPNLQPEREGYDHFKAYAASKLLQVAYGRELARRLEGRGVIVSILHPGIVKTQMLTPMSAQQQPFSLLDLERKARQDALKYILDQFQRTEDLDRLDSIRTRITDQKMATEAQLKMALNGQLDGCRTGLEKLDTSVDKSQQCRTRLYEMAEWIQEIPSLSSRLQELKNLSQKYSQLAAAMENMSYLVKLPEAVSQANQFIKSQALLDAHKILQELEGIRDELMTEAHRDGAKSDIVTLRTYFADVKQINEQIEAMIINMASNFFTAVSSSHNHLLVDVVRVIDREERADAIWQRRLEKTKFRPDGRPKEWKRFFYSKLSKTIEDRVFDCSNELTNDERKMVMHNEAIRLLVLKDLKIAKNILPTYFPPDYQIYDRVVEMYHKAIGRHVEHLVREGLSDTQIAQLLGWINSYHGDDFMGAPFLQIDFERLKLEYPVNLLPGEHLQTLRSQYMSKTTERLRSWFNNSLAKDVVEWRKEPPPKLDGSSHYFTQLPIMIMTPITEMIGKGQILDYLGSEVRKGILKECATQVILFLQQYRSALEDYRRAYTRDRSQFPSYFEYLLANSNDSLKTSDTFTGLMFKELEGDAAFQGDMASRLNELKRGYGEIADWCLRCASETVFMDLRGVLDKIMKPTWLTGDDDTGRCLTATLNDYDTSIIHLRPASYVRLVENLADSLLVEYLFIIMTRRVSLKNTQRDAVAKIIDSDGRLLSQYFGEKLKDKGDLKICDAYEVLTEIANLFRNRDISMLPLDITNLQQKFPDIRTSHIYALLMASNDLRQNQANDYAQGYEDCRGSGTSPRNIFTKLVAREQM